MEPKSQNIFTSVGFMPYIITFWVPLKAELQISTSVQAVYLESDPRKQWLGIGKIKIGYERKDVLPSCHCSGKLGSILPKTPEELYKMQLHCPPEGWKKAAFVYQLQSLTGKDPHGVWTLLNLQICTCTSAKRVSHIYIPQLSHVENPGSESEADEVLGGCFNMKQVA